MSGRESVAKETSTMGSPIMAGPLPNVSNLQNSTHFNKEPSTEALAVTRRRTSKSNPSRTIARSTSTPHLSSAIGVAPRSSLLDFDKKKSKLGYQRTTVACSHCRRRKIRCMIANEDTSERCVNCTRLNKDCVYLPIEPATPRVQRRPNAISGDCDAGSNSTPSLTESPAIMQSRDQVEESNKDETEQLSFAPPSLEYSTSKSLASQDGLIYPMSRDFREVNESSEQYDEQSIWDNTGNQGVLALRPDRSAALLQLPSHGLWTAPELFGQPGPLLLPRSDSNFPFALTHHETYLPYGQPANATNWHEPIFNTTSPQSVEDMHHHSSSRPMSTIRQRSLPISFQSYYGTTNYFASALSEQGQMPGEYHVEYGPRDNAVPWDLPGDSPPQQCIHDDQYNTPAQQTYNVSWYHPAPT